MQKKKKEREGGEERKRERCPWQPIASFPIMADRLRPRPDQHVTADVLHDDWMICLRLNPSLIDSEMSESAILK